MSQKALRNAQQDAPQTGQLQLQVNSVLGFVPIENATITISYARDPDTIIEQVRTDSSGETANIDLPAPPIEYSMEPVEQQPYSEYNLRIDAEGYDPVFISGTEILPDTLAIQPVRMEPIENQLVTENIVIPEHTLYGVYPPKIPEAEIKPVNESGEIVLSRVVIPEYVIVHDGVPEDASAPNYYVRYRDYIKNVVSSEIYATWSENTIYANTLAILSFTLNRVYTEW